MRNKSIGVLGIALLLILGTILPAVAETEGPLWDDDSVIAEDSHGTIVTEPDPTDPPDFDEQTATITLDGPLGLEVGTEGTYTVEVTNTSDTRDLDEWVLGLSVTNIEDVGELTINYAEGSTDITDGTSGVDVWLDTDESILYLRGSDDPTIEVKESDTFEFDVTFHKTGQFTGTAYVISTDIGDPFEGLEADDHQFYPYYDEDAGTNQDKDPTFTTHPIEPDGDFVVCTLDRTRYRDEGTHVISDNRVKCYEADGKLGYEHYLTIVSENHEPFYSNLVDAGHPTGFSGEWVMLSLEVDGNEVDLTGDTSDYDYLGFS